MEGQVVGKTLIVRKKHHMEVRCVKDKAIVAANTVPYDGIWYYRVQSLVVPLQCSLLDYSVMLT
jgi:hypothetical protein